MAIPGNPTTGGDEPLVQQITRLETTTHPTDLSRSPGPDPGYVTRIAQTVIDILHHFNFTDAEIAERFLIDHPFADRMFDNVQKDTQGTIYAPAALVKQEVRKLLAARPTA